jgi:hypothetical protein
MHDVKTNFSFLVTYFLCHFLPFLFMSVNWNDVECNFVKVIFTEKWKIVLMCIMKQFSILVQKNMTMVKHRGS